MAWPLLVHWRPCGGGRRGAVGCGRGGRARSNGAHLAPANHRPGHGLRRGAVGARDGSSSSGGGARGLGSGRNLYHGQPQADRFGGEAFCKKNKNKYLQALAAVAGFPPGSRAREVAEAQAAGIQAALSGSGSGSSKEEGSSGAAGAAAAAAAAAKEEPAEAKEEAAEAK